MQQKTLKWYWNVENLIRQAQTFTGNANLAHLFRKKSVNPWLNPIQETLKLNFQFPLISGLKKKKKN